MTLRNILMVFLVIAFSPVWGAARKPATGATSGSPSPAIGDGIATLDAFSNPDSDGHRKIIDTLGALEKNDKVRMWMFSMSDPNVVQALIDADKVGVDITIIFNDAMFNGDEKKIVCDLKVGVLPKSSEEETSSQDYQACLSATSDTFLQDNQVGTGIHILRASPKFSITHAKTFIVDSARSGEFAWIMSLNTTNNQAIQADYAVKTNDRAVLTDLKALYAVDVANAAEKTGNEANITSNNLIVSPINSLDRILQLINSAKTSIDMTVENLAYTLPTATNAKSFTQIVDALKAQMAKGVTVRVITPGCDMNPSNPGFNLTALSQLNESGKDVGRVMLPYPATAEHPYMHQKIIIIDRERFYVGSENFSSNSLMSAREIGVIAKIAGPTTGINDLFQTEWNNAPKSLPASIPRNCQAIGAPTTASETMNKEPEDTAKITEMKTAAKKKKKTVG